MVGSRRSNAAKRQAAAELLRADPQRSDHAIAIEAAIDGSVVRRVRAELEEIGVIPEMPVRRDTVGRRHPARHATMAR